MNIRKFMRFKILPIKEMQDEIKKLEIDKSYPVLDFGAGTLCWSEWFVKELDTTVVAVDPLYKNAKIAPPSENILLYENINKVNNPKFSMIFACDVFHHLDQQSLKDSLEYFTNHSDFIVFKDIDAHDKIGNLQNKLHDFFINHQWVLNIYSSEIENYFINKGYTVKKMSLKKFGYSHFFIVAKKLKFK